MPLTELPWEGLPVLELVRSEDGGKPRQGTRVRLAASASHLWVRFDCEDEEAWGTYRERDAPLYEEEVVEVFLAPVAGGEEVPRRYVELEVSPLGTLFDAVVDNPTGDRADLVADTSWDCPGLAWEAGRLEGVGRTGREDWWAALSIPWRSVVTGVGLEDAPAGASPALWRVNLYRIDRPRDSAPEHSAWSPPLVAPADFHRPERFGLLTRSVGRSAGR